MASPVLGQPVRASGVDASTQASNAAEATARCTGLVVSTGAPATIQSSGIVTLTAAEWDAVVDIPVGGLITGDAYYVSVGPGKLTPTKPAVAGEWIAQVGVALSATELLLSTPCVPTAV